MPLELRQSESYTGDKHVSFPGQDLPATRGRIRERFIVGFQI